MDSWEQARLALKLLAAAPGFGGIVIRARPGPARDRFIEMAKGLPEPVSKVHPSIDDEALLGGLDLTATLAQGRYVARKGILARGGTIILTMAERCPPGLAARLAAAMDLRPDLRLIILDEGASVEEAAPQALYERCAFAVDLSETPLAACSEGIMLRTAPNEAVIGADQIVSMTRVAADLGIDSLRGPQFAIRAARTLAGLSGLAEVDDETLERASILTLAHRATRLPEPTQEDDPQPPSEVDAPEQAMGDIPDEVILDAVRAHLPADILDQLARQKARSGRGNGSGGQRKGNRRGRPLPAQRRPLSDGARLDLIGTLRAAAPWQTIRRREMGRAGLQIRRDDIHVKRYTIRSDRLLIFVVDASGSAAFARLAEAKGAIELLLSQAYARRDHVSLVAFRGKEADLLLPATRSLVQTKRRLAGLPGGGGTPLAAGLQEGLQQALLAKRQGMTPTVIVLTDGRANIALDGRADRAAAGQDATRMSQAMRAHQIDALVIDTGKRSEPALRTLAQTLDAGYLPLPRADAQRLSNAVTTALEG